MAVPFNMPDEDDGVDEIIRQLQILLIRLSERRRRSISSPNNSSQSSPSSSSHSSSSSSSSSSSQSSQSSSSIRSSLSRVRSSLQNHQQQHQTYQQQQQQQQQQQYQYHHQHRRSGDELNLSHADLPDVVVWRETFARLPYRIPIRRRSSSESSCCDDAKTTEIHDNQDCIQNEESSLSAGDLHHFGSRKAILARDGLSRFFPENLRWSLWTTAFPVICMVGWHLFQTTYDCI